MALPSNDHHVHSDGYYSDKGEIDTGRMMEELADEIEQVPGVQGVWPEEDRVEVEYDGNNETYEECEEIAAEWNCRIPTVGDEWLEVRPKA